MFFLSVWRISKIVTEEEGPGMIFSRLREISGAEYDGVPEQWDLLSWHSKLLQCPYCLSVWVALFLALLRIINRKLYRITVVTFSGSAATVLIEDLNNG